MDPSGENLLSEHVIEDDLERQGLCGVSPAGHPGSLVDMEEEDIIVEPHAEPHAEELLDGDVQHAGEVWGNLPMPVSNVSPLEFDAVPDWS